jgi:hypothetical protein
MIENEPRYGLARAVPAPKGLPTTTTAYEERADRPSSYEARKWWFSQLPFCPQDKCRAKRDDLPKKHWSQKWLAPPPERAWRPNPARSWWPGACAGCESFPRSPRTDVRRYPSSASETGDKRPRSRSTSLVSQPTTQRHWPLQYRLIPTVPTVGLRAEPPAP